MPSWIKLGSLRGPQGFNGKDGESIQGPPGRDGKDGKDAENYNKVHYSVLIPKNDIGEDGDWCFCETNEILRKEKGKWIFYKTFNMGSGGGGGGGGSGAGITELTGDVTAIGPGIAAATLATVNANVGSFGSASQVPVITVNGKGLITAVTNTAIAISAAAVSGLATVAITGAHSDLSGLTTGDQHTQYALLAGRSGGQTLTGGTAASNNLILRSTSNATKGQVWIDETTASSSTTTGALRVDGGIGLAGALVFGGDPLPSTNNARNLGSSSLRMATLFSNRIANYTSTTVTPTVTGPVLLSGRYNNTGGGTTTVSVVSVGSSAANFLLGSVLNTSADTATFSVGGGGNFGGGVVIDGGTISIVGQSNFVWGRSAGAGSSISTDIAAEGNFVYGEAFPGAVGASSISASGAAAAGCFVGGWIQGSDTSATPSTINGSYFGCFAQGMIVDGGNIGAGGAGLGPFAQGYATLLGQIQSTGDGSFAQGYAEEGDISASARGTVAHGAVVGSYSIAASSSGAIALGYANGADITASGDGSGAFGYAYGGTNIVASASNAFQFARGTNSTADSLQIGVSGTGVKIYGSGQIDIPGVLNHDGTTLGFYAVTPVTRPAAYTQTYSTATRTHSNLTSSTLTDSTTGTANTTVQDVGAAFSQATLNDNFADVVAQINALRVDLVNAKGVLNQVIDDLQSNGLLQ